jgi:ATP-dependent Clp protease ATP-binding subunit ClpC
MFERYTEKARRVIFFARYEASQFGSPLIETEHLLLGILREDKALTNRFLRSHVVVESIRKQIEEHTTIREKVSTSVDLPLSNESKRVLAYAAEEAEKMGHKHIGPEHLLLGLMREEKGFAAEMLKERGLKLKQVREEATQLAQERPPVQKAPTPAPPSENARDLTQAAVDGLLDPLVARDEELDAVIEILGRRDHRNPVLLGEHGVGKTALVDLLAQRITEAAPGHFLAEKRIFAVDLNGPVGARRGPTETDEAVSAISRALGRERVDEVLRRMIETLCEVPETVLFIDDLEDLFPSPAVARVSPGLSLLKPALLGGKAQFIAACEADAYDRLCESAPWLRNCFRAVFVRPMDKDETYQVLVARKPIYEKAHGVTYSDEALQCAAERSVSYLVPGSFPGKALELIDAAGARVKLRQGAPPAEVAEVQKRIRFISLRMAQAIVNHEFEKARFYSDEERKEKEGLRVLLEAMSPYPALSTVVGREDIEAEITRGAEYPFRP